MFYDLNNITKPVVMYIPDSDDPKFKFLVTSEICQNPENPKNYTFLAENGSKSVQLHHIRALQVQKWGCRHQNEVPTDIF